MMISYSRAIRKSVFLSKQCVRFTTVTKSNVQVRLASRPVGLPTKDNWNITTTDVTRPQMDGDILVKISAISLDPAMRGWMNDSKSYIKPVEIGEIMRAIGIGHIIESNNLAYNVGDVVTGRFGVQSYTLLNRDNIQSLGVNHINLSLGSEEQWLNVLGMPGMTGFFGLKEIGLAKGGETLVVSAAAGAVGQTVGQLGKILGMRVVGIAGGQEKCDWVVNTLGFDACIDYKQSLKQMRTTLYEHCPAGIDVYFDNVGGDILDTVLGRINKHARIVICGAISQYNSTEGVAGPKNYLSLLINRARMEGMVVFDYAPRYNEAVMELSTYLQQGKMQSREHIVTGIENFPEALNTLFSGKNFGKLVLKV